MDFSLTDTQTQLSDAVARYAAERCDDAARRRRAAMPEGFDRAEWTRMADLGWIGAALSEADGGFGGPEEAAVVMEGVGRALMPEPLPVCAVMAPRLAARAGLADLAARLVAGTELASVAFEEPGAGWAPFAPSARLADGRLTGRKTRVQAGAAADLWFVTAAGPDGLALALVAGDAEGATTVQGRGLDGRAIADIAFDGAPVRAVALTGPAAEAALEEALDHALAAACAEALGIAEALAARTLDHLRTRRQFGQPLAAFQALQFRMADVHVALTEARAMAALATLALSADDAAERRRDLSAAFLEVTDRCLKVGAEAIQLHGGIGMTEELPVGEGYRRLKAISLGHGGRDWHLDRFIAIDMAAA